MDLTGKKALVTGGTRGIGAAITDALVKAKCQVTVIGQNQTRIDDLSNKNKNYSIDYIKVDLGSQNDIDSFIQKAALKGFDILINNAGINKIDTAHEVNMEDWNKIMDINLRASFLLAKALVPEMKKKRWGRIINIGSIFGVLSRAKRVSYSTSKFALLGMTKAMALDYAENNILINCVAPGFIDTELTRSTLKPQEIEEIINSIPLKKLGRPEDIANVVLFLASDLNQIITGQNIIADGGFTCV